jgi:RNA polymerase sigma-70 factor (ECF subfamily)
MSSVAPHSAVDLARQLASHDEADAAGAAARATPSVADLYDRYARFLWQSLRRLGVAPADVEDVCHEVFVVVHRKLAGFDHRSSIRTWIYGIALRCASDYRRRGVRREIPTADVHDQHVTGTQVDTVALGEARALLDTLLDGLDADKRAVFVLYELAELPMADVADIVGCPLQTAYSRLHAARRQVERGLDRLQARDSAP